MKRLNRILLILLWIKETNLELRLSQVKESSLLPDFTIQILTNYSGPIRKMAVFVSEHFLEVTRIIQGVQAPVTVNAEEAPLQGMDKREPCGVVLVMENPSNFIKCLNSTLWTSDTVFILILRDEGFQEQILLEVFRAFFAVNVLNVFIFVSDSRKVLLYTYRPFVSSKCDSLEVSLLSAEGGNFVLRNRLGDLHQCILNVSAVDLPPVAIYPTPESKSGTFQIHGIEVNIIYEVAKKLNFVPRFAVARDGEAWGWIHPTPHGTVGEVYLRHSHFGLGHLATTLERYECLDMTVPVSPERECVTWAVPLGAAKSRAIWIEIYVNEFSLTMWGCLVFAFGLISCMFWGVAKRSGIKYDNAVMYLFAAFIFVPVKVPKAMPLRYLFLSWVLYSFVIMISYQALVGSKLTVPFRQPDVETISDLLKTNLRLTGFNNTFRLITYEAEGDLKKVVSRIEATTFGMKEAAEYIIYDRNIAYLRETTSFKYFATNHPQARGMVHFMKECAYQYYPIMVLQRRSFLTDRTNQIISRFFESGIMMKWRKNYIQLFDRSPTPGIRLTLTHMLAPFVALSVGITSSIVVFIIEHLSHRYGKPRKIPRGGFSSGDRRSI